MNTVKIRTQGDDLVVEIPDSMVSELNWGVGTEVIVERGASVQSEKGPKR